VYDIWSCVRRLVRKRGVCLLFYTTSCHDCMSIVTKIASEPLLLIDASTYEYLFA
jgi:hypothetical protein